MSVQGDRWNEWAEGWDAMREALDDEDEFRLPPLDRGRWREQAQRSLDAIADALEELVLARMAFERRRRQTLCVIGLGLAVEVLLAVWVVAVGNGYLEHLR